MLSLRSFPTLVLWLFLLFAGLISERCSAQVVNTEKVLEAIQAREAWALGYQGSGVLVGIVDQGVEMNHPAYAGRTDNLTSYNFGSYYNSEGSTSYGSSTDYNPWWDNYMEKIVLSPGVTYTIRKDGDNHGTPVASCVNANGEIANIFGAAPKATTASLRVEILAEIPADKTQAKMITQALQYKAGEITIKNNSYGIPTGYTGNEEITAQAATISDIVKAGTILVFSAGNERDDIYTENYSNGRDANKKATQANPHTITVAATGVLVFRPSYKSG